MKFKTMFSFYVLTVMSFQIACKWDKEKTAEVNERVVQSSSFKANDSIPFRFTCKTSQQIFPQLNWSGFSADVKSFALIMDDPDAVPVAGFIWNHWILYDIPSTVTSIDEGVNTFDVIPTGAKRGKTSFGDTSYGGPCPPPGQLHHYHFRLFGLNVDKTGLNSGATAAQLRTAMSGKIVDSAVLVGTFIR